MISYRGKVSLAALVPCVAWLVVEAARESRAQDSRAAADVNVVNTATAPVQSKIVNPASAPVQARLVNTTATPVPATILNTAAAPVQAKIVNATASPLPTSILNTPSVNARQSGTWNVSIANRSTNPVSVQEIDQTFSVSRGVVISDHVGFVEINLAAPTGRIAMIEEVSFQVLLPRGEEAPDITFTTARKNGQLVALHSVFFAYSRVASLLTWDLWRSAQETRLYHDPNYSIRFVIERQHTGYGNGTITLHGRFIPVPVPITRAD